MIKDKRKKISYDTLRSNRRLGEFVEIITNKNKLKKKDEILEVMH
jgi:hypothetical protein